MFKLPRHKPSRFRGQVHADRRQGRSRPSIGCESLEGRALLAAGASTAGGTLTQAVTQLQADLHTLAAKSQVTVSELTALSDALLKDQADATSRPTAASLSALQTELLTEAQDGTLNTQTLLTDEAAVLTGAGVPTADVTATTTAQAAIFTSSAVTGADLKTINADLTAIQNATPTRSHGFNFGGSGGIVGQTTGVLGSVLDLPVGFFSRLNGYHPGTTGTGTATSTNPVDVARAKLQADEHALAAKSQVTTAELTTLSTALQTAQKDATSRPTAASLSALQTEITTEAQAGTLTPATIEADVAAVLTGAGVPTADATAVTKALDAVITSSGLTGTDLQTIYNDQQALKAAIAANPPTRHGWRR